jgi:hypothetical protein
VSFTPGPARRATIGRRRPALGQRRVRLTLLAAALVLVIAVIVSGIGGGSLPLPPKAGTEAGAAPGDPFAYLPAREGEFASRATAGNAHVLFSMSPGGAVATAARVAAFRPLIDRVTAGTGINSDLLEGLVFVESAGRPEVIAGSDPADAAGLTQILAQTGQSLLGMKINVAASRKLTSQIDGVASGTRRGYLAPLLAKRAVVDARFDPGRALAATIRYLRYAEGQFGRQDLAFESYHMGIGNLKQALTDYDGGRPVPYVQLYFDTAPDHHRAAYDLLSSLGDDSSLYYWRILGAVAIMHLYRTDRAALTRLAGLQNATDSNAIVLHPTDVTPGFADPAALAAAYQRHTLVPLPANAQQLGIDALRSVGAAARRIGAPVALYRGLRPVALRLLIAMAARVRTLSGGAAPLQLAGAVSDAQYQRHTGDSFTPATDGYSFQIRRRYVNGSQAVALQAMLDRLQALNLIAWAREPSVIDVTVASDAGGWLR